LKILDREELLIDWHTFDM